MNQEEFTQYYSLNGQQLLWFLGAGAARSAGMPSATDIIWDLKRRHYCTKENRDISDNELSNEAIKNKIQSYLESVGCPSPGAEDEYSFYFRKVLGEDATAHQKYLEEALHPEKISINSGHRILAALMAMRKCKIVFTTNFDSVLENAYAFMTGQSLHAFSLDGSYAALNALNNEQFPLYAKLHGDFRYFAMKNLPDQLLTNDLEIERCFVNACTRYGAVVAGYSGRDKNVMSAFEKALEQDNAFPKGLFWLTPIDGYAFSGVGKLISKAKSKGINAEVISADTFDSIMGRIWKITDQKPKSFDEKIRRGQYTSLKIPRYPKEGGYPLIRTNAFPILKMPESCLSITIKEPMTTAAFVEAKRASNSAAITIKEKTILAWGSMEEIFKVIPESQIERSEVIDINKYLTVFKENSLVVSFLSQALARSLAKEKPVRLRKRKGKYYVVLSSKHTDFPKIDSILKEGLKTYNWSAKEFTRPESLVGKVPNLPGAFWMEAVEISLEHHDNAFWLILRPDIWIEPEESRQGAKDFLLSKKRNRYNNIQHSLLNGWREVLLGHERSISLKPFGDSVDNNPIFVISSITAFSGKITK
ncbi:MAG: SIR2 family protein [Marivirga sp.]|nr:SIR2 family protein [Marivirga sp.]